MILHPNNTNGIIPNGNSPSHTPLKEHCVIDVDNDVNNSIYKHPSVSYTQNIAIGSISNHDNNDALTSKIDFQEILIDGVQNIPLKKSRIGSNTDISENLSDCELPTSSSFLLEKSSDSVQFTSPNGSCLRGGSKGEGSSSTGQHVQFETSTPSSDDLFGKNVPLLGGSNFQYNLVLCLLSQKIHKFYH